MKGVESHPIGIPINWRKHKLPKVKKQLSTKQLIANFKDIVSAPNLDFCWLLVQIDQFIVIPMNRLSPHWHKKLIEIKVFGMEYAYME